MTMKCILFNVLLLIVIQNINTCSIIGDAAYKSYCQSDAAFNSSCTTNCTTSTPLGNICCTSDCCGNIIYQLDNTVPFPRSQTRLLQNTNTVLNYNFEQDSVPIGSYLYKCPTSWSCYGETVLVRRTNSDWAHASNVNGGLVFLGLQATLGQSYIQQTVLSDPNSIFSITFDVSYRTGFTVGLLSVYCNIPGGGAVLSFYPTDSWGTVTSDPKCVTDASGKATIKFVHGPNADASDRTVFIDNVYFTIG